MLWESVGSDISLLNPYTVVINPVFASSADPDNPADNGPLVGICAVCEYFLDFKRKLIWDDICADIALRYCKSSCRIQYCQ